MNTLPAAGVDSGVFRLADFVRPVTTVAVGAATELKSVSRPMVG